MEIRNSKNLEDGICIWFSNEYYAHGITKLGNPDESPRSDVDSAWSWINHLRGKNWWNVPLETAFLEEVTKYIS